MIRSPFARLHSAFLILALAWTMTPRDLAQAQQPGAGAGRQRPPAVVSPEVQADRRITFRILAPSAEAVRLNSSDLPGDPRQQRTLTKGENGVWALTLDPVDPGTYRYTFNVDGVSVVDPRNQSISESNGNVWSILHVPGSDFMDTTDVPHGSVARIHYRSSTLGRTRRMHVYTPPGYEAGQEKYPVFYLLHGAGDCDDSWTSVGRANFIIDNLIAAGKARPMIVVMPAGHTGPFGFGAPRAPSADGRPNLGANAFEEDFNKDIRPYIEKHYRVLADRQNRAIAGLSMGGAQTLSIAIPNLKDYGYVGVFSSGLLFRGLDEWEKDNQAILADASAKEGLKLVWFATGSQDFLINQTRQSVEFLKKHKFNPVFKETTGGHTWINWQKYLNEFAPQLFGGAGTQAGAPQAAPAPERPATPAPGAAPAGQRRGGQGMRTPRPGPTPLPILPALPAHGDTSFYAKADVPHGKVEQTTYTTQAGQQKRMHVYLPPDYDKSADRRYPVLYLNHGGGDDDSRWTSTDPRSGGSAQFILDNLIAAGKARPMIVVMPNTRGIASPEPPAPGQDDACSQEFLKDIIPHVEKTYRARPGRENRALAGLSMGGFVVMGTGLSHLDTFGELYVYSSGYFADRMTAFEENFKQIFSDPKTNQELLRVPLYTAAGETDIALANAQRTLSVINKYAVRNFWVLSSGGHEWANWRRYLHQTAQIMFPESPIR